MSYNELKQHGSEDFPIQLYTIDRMHPKYEMAYHWHTQLEIIRVISGILIVSLNSTEYMASAGDVVIVNSEVVHGAVPQNCVYECIVFSLDVLETSINKCKNFLFGISSRMIEITEYYKYNNSIFFETANNLFEAMKENGDGTKFKVLGALYELFGIISDNRYYKISSGAEVNKSITKLKDVLYFIRTCYESPITLEDMAAKAGMSPKYFCRFFKELTDKTPVEYLNTYRIERAARKLMGTDLPITEIAFSCGFNDLSYFIKTFKKYKGITPREFRKRHY